MLPKFRLVYFNDNNKCKICLVHTHTHIDIRSIYALSTYEQEQDMGSLLGQKNNQTTFERWKDKQIEKMQKGTN